MYKHPKALAFLFFAEMWERFSFYGMRALLTLYLTLQLFKDLQEPEKKATAFGIYAAYGALVYATPFIGGIVADKILGHKKAVVWGAVLMAIGHFVMAIETEFWLYIALAFLIIGNGFFKPNMSSIVGELYEEGDPRRDGGFTIFYMGINLGAFLSPLICGTVGELYGWHYGFGIAGIGMMAGLFVFMRNKHLLQTREHIVQTPQGSIIEHRACDIGKPPYKAEDSRALWFGISKEYMVYACSIAIVALFAVLVRNFEYMTYVLTPFALFVIGVLFVTAIRSPKVERDRLFVILLLMVFTILFWAFFEQAGSSLTLYANENVDRNLFAWQIPTSVFQSVNPLFILMFASPFTMLWLYLASKGKEPATPYKFSLGILLLSIGFLLLALAPFFTTNVLLDITKGTTTWQLHAAAVPMFFLIVCYLFQTLGELCLSPIGLSMVTKLASPKIVGMVMGGWMVTWSLAHHVGGVIANFTNTEESTTEYMWQVLEPELQNLEYTISQQEFLSKYRSTLKTSVTYGFDILLDDARHIIASESSEQPNTQRVLDSTIAVLSRQGVMDVVVSHEAFSNALLQSIHTGAVHMKKIGDTAMNEAIAKKYVSSTDTQAYSLASRYSLANLLQYTNVFFVVGLIALASAILLFLLSPAITKMMHGIK